MVLRPRAARRRPPRGARRLEWASVGASVPPFEGKTGSEETLVVALPASRCSGCNLRRRRWSAKEAGSILRCWLTGAMGADSTTSGGWLLRPRRACLATNGCATRPAIVFLPISLGLVAGWEVGRNARVGCLAPAPSAVVIWAVVDWVVGCGEVEEPVAGMVLAGFRLGWPASPGVVKGSFVSSNSCLASDPTAWPACTRSSRRMASVPTATSPSSKPSSGKSRRERRHHGRGAAGRGSCCLIAAQAPGGGAWP